MAKFCVDIRREYLFVFKIFFNTWCWWDILYVRISILGSPCTKDVCPSNAKCEEDKVGNHRCVCKPGFIGWYSRNSAEFNWWLMTEGVCSESVTLVVLWSNVPTILRFELKQCQEHLKSRFFIENRNNRNWIWTEPPWPPHKFQVWSIFIFDFIWRTTSRRCSVRLNIESRQLVQHYCSIV